MIEPAAERLTDEQIEREMATTARDVARKVHLENQRSQQRDAFKQAVRAQWKLLVGASLACFGLTAMNVLGVGPFDRTPLALTGAEQEAANRRVIQLEAAWADSYRQENGRVPDGPSARAAGGPGLPWRYERLGPKDFRVVIEEGEVATQFDSRVDPADFFQVEGERR